MEKYSAPKGFRRAPWSLVLLAISLCLVSANAFGEEPRRDSKLRRIKHIVVIYQENWSFDSLYGLFPGANGLAQSSAASLNQTDRFDQPLSAQVGQPFSLVSGSLLPDHAAAADQRRGRSTRALPPDSIRFFPTTF